MNIGLKKYLENIIGDNILRKMFFGKLSPGGLGQSGPDSSLVPRYRIQKIGNLLWTQSGRTELSPGGLEYGFEMHFSETDY